MIAVIYLGEKKTSNLLAWVDNLEVCPRGIYRIDDKDYELKGQPKFIISGADRGINKLVKVELIVEEYFPPTIDMDQ
jgi:hypothetical protein